MKFKEFKETTEYKTADVLDLFSEETGVEFDVNFPEEKLDKMEVESAYGDGWITVVLKG